MMTADDELRELDEAIEASDAALEHLERARQLLDSASGWGVVDMIGGGMFSTFVKRAKMHEAQQEVQLAQNAMSVFRRELMDVEWVDAAGMGQDGFLGAADYFFDGVLADVMSYERIQRSRDQLERTIRQVEGIRERLIRREEEIVSLFR